jgi:hypothetical protein
MRILSIILLCLTFFDLKLSAQQIITDRPDQTESAVTVPVRSFQIETGLQAGWSGHAGSEEREFLLPATLLRYGLTKTVELRMAGQFVKVKNDLDQGSDFGFGDLEVGAKFQILKKEGSNTEIAFLSHLIIPAGLSEISIGAVGITEKIAFSHELSENLELGYNLGYGYFGSGKGDLIYSVTFGIGLSEKFGLYGETYGSVNEFQKFVSNFDSGISWLLKDNLQLDLSFGAGLNYRMNYISLGGSWNIGGMRRN